MLKVTGGKWKPPEHFKTKYIYSKKKKKKKTSGEVLFLLQQNAIKLRLGSSLIAFTSAPFAIP